MQKKRTNRAGISQYLARAGSGALLIGIVAVGGLTLTGYTYPGQTAAPTVTYTQLTGKMASGTTATAKPASPSAPPSATIAPTQAPAAYDFSSPVPESAAVEPEWFSDAAFIGDSRTEGLVLYAKVKPGGSFAYRGLNVQTARTDKVIKTKDGAKKTAIDALKQGTYDKVYLSLGVNELGWYNNKRYYSNYSDLIDLVRAAQPNAQIYLQTLIPVTAAKSAASYINNPQILVYNKLVAQLAEEKQVYLVDAWSAFADSTGSLPAKGSVDGVHLTKEYYGTWFDYLKTHTVSSEDSKGT